MVFRTWKYLQNFRVEANDVEWRIPFCDVLLTSTGISYLNGEVCDKDKVAYVDKLVQRGVVRGIDPIEKAIFSLVLKKKTTDKKNKIRKVMECRKLNIYSKPHISFKLFFSNGPINF